MSGKERYPGTNERRVNTALNDFFPHVSAQDIVPLQEALSSQEAHRYLNISEGHLSPRSNSPSPVNRTPRTSFSLQTSNSVQYDATEKHYSPHEKHKAQEKYPSRRSSWSPGGYDHVSFEGYSNERSMARADNNPQHLSPPLDDGGSYSDDNGDSRENTFSEKAIRRAFIQKVYSLLMCMMLFASAFISFMMFYSPARMFILHNMWLVILSWALYPVLMLVLICSEKLRRTVPWNYFVLFLITLSLSFMAACSAARYNKLEVLAAFAITAVLCLGLTVFAFQTKWDFTVISGGLVIASLVLFIFGMVLIFWRNKIAMIGYASLGALLGCFFFIFDTQMIMGGNHRYAIHPEEYVFAAITLFSDIINIFIMVTNIIGLSRS